MIKVTLEFATQDALVAFFSRPQITVAPLAKAEPASHPTPAAQSEAPAPSTPAAKRGRKSQKENGLPGATGAGNGDGQETVPANGPSAPPEHTPQAEGAGKGADVPGATPAPIENVTIEQARAAMNDVMQHFGEQGLEKVAEILNGIGFQRISEVTADKYPLVVERCKAALAA